VEAHKGAVLALHTREGDGGLISGGKDGFVIFWDTNVKQKDKIIVSNLNLKIMNLKV